MRLRPLLALAVTAALLAPLPQLVASAAPPSSAGRAAAQDAVVIAVIDSGFSPYHQDFLGERMPEQARPPLAKSPHTWLPGFPKPSQFAAYSPLKLTLDPADDVKMEELHAKDE